MYNNDCNKIIICNNDKYIEVKFINNYIVFDTLIDEDYITINKIDDLFTHHYLNNKNTLINRDSHLNENEISINNFILETPNEEISNQSLIFKNENKNIAIGSDMEVDSLNSYRVCDPLIDTETAPPDDQETNDEDDSDDEEEEDINNQITEYREELLMIETEVNILNNIILNMMVYNEKNTFILYKFKTRIYNKKNCDTLMAQIKKLSERKKIIEATINDIYKLMKIYEK